MSLSYIPNNESVSPSYYKKGEVLSEEDKKDPRKVGVLFESLFYQMMLKEMRSSKLEESPLDSQDSEFYKEMWDNELSVKLAERGELGVADMVAKFIEERNGPTEKIGMLKEVGGAK